MGHDSGLTMQNSIYNLMQQEIKKMSETTEYERGYKEGQANGKQRGYDDGLQSAERDIQYKINQRRRERTVFWGIFVYLFVAFWTFAHTYESVLRVRPDGTTPTPAGERAGLSLVAAVTWPVYWAGAGAITAHRIVFKKEQP